MEKRLDTQVEHSWHTAINDFVQTVTDKDWRPWMYEAKTIADELPRLTYLFELERVGKGDHLTCCLGVKCKTCPELVALEKMVNVTVEQIDTVKAWTCISHVMSKGGDVMREGYVLTENDRKFWDKVYSLT